MSHPEQLGFFELVARRNRHLGGETSVIEIGSYDVNGSVRRAFAWSSRYLGVDLAPGPGVDLVAFGHQVDHPDGFYDIAISGECFEHDPHWAATFSTMCRLTRPGGLVAFTCASIGRPEHGTRRTDLHESPGTQAQGLDYYRNLSERDFRALESLDDLFLECGFWYLPTSFDLYFAGVRRLEPSTVGQARPQALLPQDQEVATLARLMSLPHRAVRLPLRLLGRVVPENRYQSMILPYWRTLLRLQDLVTGGSFRRQAR